VMAALVVDSITPHAFKHEKGAGVVVVKFHIDDQHYEYRLSGNLAKRVAEVEEEERRGFSNVVALIEFIDSERERLDAIYSEREQRAKNKRRLSR